jgi:hypothetical protein
MRWSERRTAVRSTFEMTSKLPLRATRVRVRRRSSCLVRPSMRTVLSVGVAVFFSLSCWMLIVTEEALGPLSRPLPDENARAAIACVVYASQPWLILVYMTLHSGYHPNPFDTAPHRLWIASLEILSAAALAFALIRLQRFPTGHATVVAVILAFSIVTVVESIRDYRFAERWYKEYAD